MANIAHQHETTPGQPQLAASGSGIDAVRIELAVHGSSALLECCRKRAFDKTQPIAIDRDLVLGIDRSDAVFEIHDSGDRRFQHNVGDARRIIASDRSAAIDLDLQVKTVVAQQHCRWRARLTPITGELGGPRKAGTRAVTQSHQQIGAFY